MMRHWHASVFYTIFYLFIALTGCSPAKEQETPKAMTSPAPSGNWPQGITYEIFVQSFYDSGKDGIGDIEGMQQKLDYLQDLGVEAIWLMPVNPSPSYHKYDVTDYRDIHPDYGTLEEFKDFVEEAHKRNIKVIIDLVINHTSSEHPWFQAAVADTASPYRDYYVWAREDSIKDQIAKKKVTLDSDNIEQWHKTPGNEELYYGFFWSGMPDLNFDNPEVRREIYEIGKFWLQEVGVDGFRLDAAKHIYPDDRPEDNHAFWVEFKEEMEAVNPEVYLVGEVWDTAEKIAPYLKGLDAVFNFDLSYMILDAVNTGKADSLVIKHKQIRDVYAATAPGFVDATFLTNHDQERIMSQVGNSTEKAKLAASLLFTLPGAPYIYYGEETGMRGKKPDEYIREPFLWQADEEDKGRPTWMQPEYSTFETVVPAQMQQEDPNSLLNHYKQLISLRKGSEVLTKGIIAPLPSEVPDNVIGFYRVHEGDSLQVYHNLSGADQFLKIPAATGWEARLSLPLAGGAEEGTVHLPPYGTLILRLATEAAATEAAME